ncbi:hypothetical protein, partial [Kineococcus rubinsiae]|uniref:hypothetical protein n=1 Tax=Kineococcus rubinsiae TaxID=2609562 RepID=UPI001430226D
GWRDLRRAPHAAAAALAVTAVPVLLSLMLPGAFLLLPALWVLALHAVHRRLVLPRVARVDGAPVDLASVDLAPSQR